MRIHKFTVNNEVVTAYKNCDVWVIKSTNHSNDRFPVSKWTLKEAVRFYIELYKVGE